MTQSSEKLKETPEKLVKGHRTQLSMSDPARPDTSELSDVNEESKVSDGFASLNNSKVVQVIDNLRSPGESFNQGQFQTFESSKDNISPFDGSFARREVDMVVQSITGDRDNALDNSKAEDESKIEVVSDLDDCVPESMESSPTAGGTRSKWTKNIVIFNEVESQFEEERSELDHQDDKEAVRVGSLGHSPEKGNDSNVIKEEELAAGEYDSESEPKSSTDKFKDLKIDSLQDVKISDAANTYPSPAILTSRSAVADPIVYEDEIFMVKPSHGESHEEKVGRHK